MTDAAAPLRAIAEPSPAPADEGVARWGAVAALTLCVSTLIASEFMPVSLLTPIAADLHLTEGVAGQAISVSGLFAVITSLSIVSVTRTLDRRRLLLGLTVLMLLSGVVVATAQSFAVLMIGRALVGVVIGGFWSMSAATVMRLVPAKDVPRALGLLNGGNALATTIAAPLGSFLGQYVGWRGAFFAVVPLAVLTFAWQFATLPSLPARVRARAHAFSVLVRPGAARGMASIALMFMGQFTLFTYLRPFLERVTKVEVSTLSLLLLGLGLSGVAGAWLIGFVVAKRMRMLLVLMPLLMGGIALGLIVFGAQLVPTALLLCGWGFIATAGPVVRWTWLSRTLADDAEAGGGMMVAVIQLAITLGGTLGGFLFDHGGHVPTFLVSAGLLCASALVALTSVSKGRASRSSPQ